MKTKQEIKEETCPIEEYYSDEDEECSDVFDDEEDHGEREQ